MKLLAFGEVLWDVYPNDRFIGGASLNFAAHCARHNDQAYLLSAVGADTLGEITLQTLHDQNIHTDYVCVLPHKQTGRCMVTLDENAIPSYDLLTDVAWDFIDCEAATRDHFDVLYFGTLALRGETNRNRLQALLKTSRFQEIFVDVNIRPPFYSPDSIRFALENATIVKISDEELPTVASALDIVCSEDQRKNARLLADRYPNLRLLLITLGSKGALVLDTATGQIVSQPAPETQVVSTVGAGDSFGAAFLTCYFRAMAIRDCLQYATKLAAFVVSQQAAVPEYTPEWM